MSDELKEQLRKDAQAIGAALSRRCWQSVESAYNKIRDRIDAIPSQAVAQPTAEVVREACAKVAEGEMAAREVENQAGSLIGLGGSCAARRIAATIRAMPLPKAPEGQSDARATR